MYTTRNPEQIREVSPANLGEANEFLYAAAVIPGKSKRDLKDLTTIAAGVRAYRDRDGQGEVPVFPGNQADMIEDGLLYLANYQGHHHADHRDAARQILLDAKPESTFAVAEDPIQIAISYPEHDRERLGGMAIAHVRKPHNQ